MRFIILLNGPAASVVFRHWGAPDKSKQECADQYVRNCTHRGILSIRKLEASLCFVTTAGDPVLGSDHVHGAESEIKLRRRTITQHHEPERSTIHGAAVPGTALSAHPAKHRGGWLEGRMLRMAFRLRQPPSRKLKPLHKAMVHKSKVKRLWRDRPCGRESVPRLIRRGL
jgi:hypothetical protein